MKRKGILAIGMFLAWAHLAAPRLEAQCSQINIMKAGNGTGVVTGIEGSINCGSQCSVYYCKPRISGPLEATPDAGSAFLGWEGACSGTACWISWSCANPGPGLCNVTARFAATGGRLRSLTPCRLLDTRSTDGTFGGPAIGAAGTPDRSFPLADGACGVPADAAAVAVNATVVSPAASGDLLLYPGDVPDPGVATNVAFSAGQTRAATTILRLAPDGHGTVKVRNRAPGTLDLILDVTGYLTTPGT